MIDDLKTGLLSPGTTPDLPWGRTYLFCNGFNVLYWNSLIVGSNDEFEEVVAENFEHHAHIYWNTVKEYFADARGKSERKT